MKVRLAAAARAYLKSEAAYLRRCNPAAAKAFLDRMSEARANLARFSELGLTAGRLPVPGSRRLVVGDYVLDYDVTDEEVVIVAVRHGRQKPPSLDDEDFDYEA